MHCYPIYFIPVYKDYAWGGTRIKHLPHRDILLPKIAESWEVTDRKDGMSIVENGPYQHLSLSDLVQLSSEDLLGKKQEKFPLLIKLIDAKQSLSVQVHPNEKAAVLLQSEPKTEMWYVLDAEKTASVVVGFSGNTTKERFLQAVEEKTVPSLLQKQKVKKGDAIYVPGGTIHAILHGCFILEVQQNSNTTYRIYDWERGRKLHTQEALKALLLEKRSEILSNQAEKKEYIKVQQTPYFSMEKWTATHSWKGPFPSFQLFFLLQGSGEITVEGKKEPFLPYRTCFAPACSKDIAINVDKNSAYLRIFVEHR